MPHRRLALVVILTTLAAARPGSAVAQPADLTVILGGRAFFQKPLP